MADRISHRGPDGEGFYWAEEGDLQVALAHRRLAIIDVAGGKQPMVSPDGNLFLFFNGEIYNFRELKRELSETYRYVFRTNSDSEVLLAAFIHWGVNCLERLRGMFALAIWDRKNAALYLARDRFGKKPLYIREFNDGFAFGSEVKSLLALPGTEPRLNEQALAQYLVFRYVPAPRTFFDGIRKLQPGHFAIYQDGRLTERRYFVAPEATASEHRLDEQETVDAFRNLLKESVRLRLVSDVPFGAYLSGGVDSSSIVALMSGHLETRVRTFSVGFSDNDPGELPYARAVARHFDTDHHEVIIAPKDIIDNIEPAIAALDGPVSEPATIPLLLLSRAAAKHVKMVLSGEGADEFLGGYVKHALERYVLLYQRIPPYMQRTLRTAAGLVPDRRFERAAHALEVLSVKDSRVRYPLWFGAFSGREFADLYKRADLDLAGACSMGTWPGQPMRGLLFFDQTSWLPDNLLERGDRMTMAASLEARMPFMDQELASFAARLPDRMRVRGWTGKWLLRRAMRGALPREIFTRKKRGFPVPLREWFRGSLERKIREVLLDRSSRSTKLLGRSRLEALVDGHCKRRTDATKPIWLLLNLELFCNAYRLGI